MRYLVLASDYDGTLAHDGRVSDSTIAALERLRGSGRAAVLVTGRQLEDLEPLFPRLDLFARVVAENGAVVYNPATREQVTLGEPPPAEFIDRLRAAGVPVATGRVVVATWEPHENTVLQVIRELGLEHQVIFNKRAVMVLPPGVNKSSGLRCAADQLGLSLHNIVGVGDAENDHALLAACEFAVAVANALPFLKQRADHVTAGDHGEGVEELIAELVDNDLRRLDARVARHDLLLGRAPAGEFCIKPYGASILVAGPSGSGKSTLVSGFTERLADAKYQYCIIDPEGDYEGASGVLALGTAEHPPGIEEILTAQDSADRNTIASLVAVPLADRPQFFASLLPRLLELRARVGRPHWLIIDEMHHLLGESAPSSFLTAIGSAGGILMITVHPDHVSRAALAMVDLVIAVGKGPDSVYRTFATALGRESPSAVSAENTNGNAHAWFPGGEAPPFPFAVEPARGERRRHRRKYAQGELPSERNFVFRGPKGKLNLRAQNLQTFMQMGDGVDDETWMYHLRCRDYSKWVKQAIKDEGLASEIEAIERVRGISPAESRKAVRAAIDRRYTAAA